MFSKPISQITESDIQTLVDNHQKESSILEYKQEVTGSDHEKKEIAKDVSAIANTDGGYLIVGVQETDGKASAITGTSKKVGRQPVEEWLESVLISNVRPKLTIKPKIIEIATDSDRVVVVLHIPESTRRPHMVIADGRNAYYKRHNYQSTYADEHEVRSMFLESKSSGDDMKEFLKSRNLIDPSASDFALTPLSKRLADGLATIRELPEGFKGKPRVVFAACPRYLDERVDIASADFRTWLDTQNTVNLFGWNLDFLEYEKTISAESIRSIKERSRGNEEAIPFRYTEVFRNGYVESGIGPEIMWSHSDMGLMFQIAWFTTSLWLFLKFTQALYEKVGYIDEITLIVALGDIENITLHGFGKKSDTVKWVQPYDFFYGSNPPTAKQKNVKIERVIAVSELNDGSIEDIVKDIAKRVSNAFGESVAKCFDDSGNFDKDGLRGFRNLH